MKNITLLSCLMIIALSSCIKDDFINDTIDPVLRITNPIDTIAESTTFQFEAMYLNNVGLEEVITQTWQSSQPNVIQISNDGLAEALQPGSSVISVEYTDGSNTLRDEIEVHVGETTIVVSTDKIGSIATTSSYKLTGDFSLKEDGSDLILEFANNYEASTALPGLYVYLTNNNTTTSNALEIGKVATFSGAHSYTIPNTGINDFKYVLYFCKPFNVKVGDGEIQ
ncbi:MAG: hypothetical protein NXI23_07895 [Bacteroidetes bacterium]|nr:hypothetical protein [Bacteroidota bacterium]